MTANSLISVSLDPPLILVSIDLKAKMHGALVAGRPFTVNILNESQADRSSLFANPNVEGNPFKNIDLVPSINGVPYMSDALAFLACRVETVFAGGDHDLALSRVEQLSPLSSDRPLLFYQGRYHTVDAQPSN